MIEYGAAGPNLRQPSLKFAHCMKPCSFSDYRYEHSCNSFRSLALQIFLQIYLVLPLFICIYFKYYKFLNWLTMAVMTVFSSLVLWPVWLIRLTVRFNRKKLKRFNRIQRLLLRGELSFENKQIPASATTMCFDFHRWTFRVEG